MADVPGFAPAKVNLYLHITGRRADGYHLLDSLAVFPAIGDQVTAEPADTLELALHGPFAAGLRGEADNLVLRAARALAAAGGVPARAALRLAKHLPIASGIGGGSADAAAALRVLSSLWRLTDVDLAAIGLTLGADIPVCVASRPARMQGIGEILSAAPRLPAGGIVLANPGIGVATPAVFRARQGDFSPPAALPDAWTGMCSMAADLARLGNDLQAPAITLCPVIGEVLARLAAAPGSLLARMSGSGATCFALFPTPQAAESAAAGMRANGWWVWGGALLT